MGIKLVTPESRAADDKALREKIRSQLVLNKPPEGIMAGLYKRIPTNVRLLAENLVGVERPITNQDFTNDELIEMAFLAQRQREANVLKEQRLKDLLTRNLEAASNPKKYEDSSILEGSSSDIADLEKALKSFADTRGKTSISPYSEVGEERIDRGRAVDKGYFDSLKSTFTDPRYGVATTLGEYNIFKTPQTGPVDFTGQIRDTYNFNKVERNLPSNPIKAVRRMAISPEILGEYLANIVGTEDRPINVELKRKQEYPVNFNYGGSVFNRGIGAL